MKLLSRVRLFATPWTVDYQALSSMGFSRQEYWSGLPPPSPGDFPNPGIEPGSPELQIRHFTICATREALLGHLVVDILDVDHLKGFIKFVTILLLLYVLVFQLQGTWDLSSLRRDQTCNPCTGRQSQPLDHQGSPCSGQLA